MKNIFCSGIFISALMVSTSSFALKNSDPPVIEVNGKAMDIFCYDLERVKLGNQYKLDVSTLENDKYNKVAKKLINPQFIQMGHQTMLCGFQPVSDGAAK